MKLVAFAELVSRPAIGRNAALGACGISKEVRNIHRMLTDNEKELCRLLEIAATRLEVLEDSAMLWSSYDSGTDLTRLVL